MGLLMWQGTEALGRCGHAAFPVEVLAVGGGKKKIAHCPRCGRSGPTREGSAEALAALREASRPASSGATPLVQELVVDGVR